MEQLYLIEIFIDKVTIFMSDSEEPSGARKNLIIKIKFGPKVEFLVKEGQLAPTEEKDDIVETDESGRRMWSRTIRVGKSFLFPACPDTVLLILSKFPLEIEVWNDDENEIDIFVGIGSMIWDSAFFHMLKETSEPCKLHEPLSIKQVTPIFAECCCRQVGDVAFILRLSALGESITTEFQQLMADPDSFVFRTNRTPSMFKCNRIEGDDPNFVMVGSLYETATLEDPDVVNNAEKKIEVCTELQSCGVRQGGADYPCAHDGAEEKPKKTYPIDRIRMGDITGPCGNTNCALAHKVRMYIRNLEAYKKEAGGISGTKDETTRKICGTCNCKDDRWHREECPTKQGEETTTKAMCSGCGGLVPTGDTCEDRKNKLEENPTKTVGYVFSLSKVADYRESMFGKDFVVGNITTCHDFQSDTGNKSSTSQNTRPTSGCCKRTDNTQFNLQTSGFSTNTKNPPKNISSSSSIGGTKSINVYNAEVKSSGKNVSVYNFCLNMPDEKDTDCKCSPPKPSPPCKTFDCDCYTKTTNLIARKHHRAYCPAFKHKQTCPVNMTHEFEEKKDEDEDETEPLPYGLPPIKLGPCPVLGRPCTNPDGFARMYKTAAQPVVPPSYTEAGKVCCSKEYERIRTEIKKYLKYEKDHDYRCINTFNIDTERRCCDKEQRLLDLMGKACCGEHKMAIQDKFKEEKK